MIAAIAVAVAVLALVARRLRRRRRAPGPPRDPAGRLDLHGAPLVASREIRERLRGRPFRVGSAFILLAVAAAIVIPVLSKSPSTPERVGLVGGATPRLVATVEDTAKRLGIEVRVTVEPSASAARRGLATGHLDLVLLADRALVVHSAIQPTDTSAIAQLAQALAEVLGIQAAYRAAGLSPYRSAGSTPPRPSRS